ncbi:MAG TPA: hypothetical protein PKL83_07105, partial [bacterium]|nr:hypothetical protein [bacterium]
GLLLFLFCLGEVVISAYRLHLSANQFWGKMLGQAVFLGSIALLIQAIFIDTFVSSKIMSIFWLLVGVMSSYRVQMREQTVGTQH